MHSRISDPIAAAFYDQLRKAQLRLPAAPYLSSVTGTWISGDEACSPDYWIRHLRETIRFDKGVTEILKEPDAILLEVGPGQTLGALAAEQMDPQRQHPVLVSLPSFRSQSSAFASALHTLGSLWMAGVEVDWPRFHQGEQRNRVVLPTYPFERARYWAQYSASGSPVVSDHQPSNGPETIPRIGIQALACSEINPLETIMAEQTTTSLVAQARLNAIASVLHSIIHELTGIQPTEKDAHIDFFDLGVDSLLIIQFTQAIQNRCGLKVPYRMLFEELTTLDAISRYLDRELPSDMFATDSAASVAVALETPTQAEQPAVTAPPQPVGSATVMAPPLTPSLPQALAKAPGPQPAAPIVIAPVASDQPNRQNGSALAEFYSQQFRVMSQQLDIMQRMNAELSGQPSEPPQHVRDVAAIDPGSAAEAPPVNGGEQLKRQPHSQAAKPMDGFGCDAGARASRASMQAPAAAGEAESFLPHKPLNIKTTKGLSLRQEQYLKEFIRNYVERTRQSKRIAQASRGPLADSGLSVGFTHLLKEIVYPIYEQRASGSKVWDVDGNEYLDLAMGYGVNLFGNAPPFITRAVEEQLRQGVALVPQLELTGKVAELICRLTGVERVNFCNSGTEAVMGALRAARTITRRRRIAMFAGSYHGWSDGTLARSVQGNGQTRSIPVAPGVDPKAVEDTLVLDYGSPQSLETLEAHANELAAILVEPVQSRRPDLQPREFLHALRELTSRSGTALIFDEMITGFRVHPGGAQAWFGVRADLVTYGKIVGGGMPIGVIAGKAAFMDAFDGGRWNYGDASYPEVDKTFFAAAFFKHPLSMAAAWATLNRLAESGPALQDDLNRRTAGMAQTLNDLFAANGAPIHVAHFASLFRFAFGKELKHAELFAYHLIHKGFLTWEGGNFYLSTAHSEDDVRAIISGVTETVEDLRRGGFLPEPAAPTGAGWRTHDAAGAALVPDGARAFAAESAGGAAAQDADNASVCDHRQGAIEPGSAGLAGTQRASSVSVEPARRDLQRRAQAPTASPSQSRRAIQFSLYFFGNYEPEFRADKYELIFKAARFADEHGFSSIWIPERHFDSFGGFSPNPSVVAAALARQTERIGLRAGSVVLPLHDPIRVAEEWAVVDNLSKGRVGISFASGWRQEDFVFAPDSYANRRDIMFRGIETVRRLWRGESLPFSVGEGRQVNIRLAPMPMQPDLPFWLTVVSPRSGVKAGEMGAGFLTNFMGQTFTDVAEKIALYRDSVTRHHGPGAGHVTVQAHTLLSDDLEAARRKVRQPLFDYFKSSLALKNGIARAEAQRVSLDSLPEEDLQYMFSGAYDHYVKEVGLIGTPEHCATVVDRLIEAGVDEVCCLIDFGVDIDTALESLHYTNELRKRYERLSQSGCDLERPASPLADRRQDRIDLQVAAPDLQPADAQAPSHEPSDPAAGPKANQVRVLPMTEGQKQLWAFAQMGDDANGGYNEAITLDMRGPLEIEAMRRALQDIVDRHEALRISFSSDGEYQYVHPSVKVTVPLLDLSRLSEPARTAEMDRWSATGVSKPFDLSHGPLFRFRLARIEVERHLLLFAYHHTIVDGQSISVFMSDLNALYTARCQGEAARLPEPEQFGNYVERRALRLQESARDANEAYWLKMFEGHLPQLDLPSDRPRGDTETFQRLRYTARLGPQISQQVFRLCKASHCTGFLLMLAAFKVFLHKLTGQRDLIVAITTADASGVGNNDLVGFRLNPLALRSRLTTDPTFLEFLSDVKGLMWEAYEHQEFSIPKLYQALKLHWRPGARSLASVKFHLDRGGGELDFHRLKVRLTDHPSPAPLLDLTLDVKEEPDDLLFRWNYNPGLFEERTIAKWMAYFELLLEAIVEDPRHRLSTLPDFVRDPAAREALASADDPLEVVGGLGLTRYQQLIWAWQKLRHDTPMYINAGVGSVDRPIELEHLRKAVAKLVENSDALRTVIREKDGEPYQEVLPRIDHLIESYDFTVSPDPYAEMWRWATRRGHSRLDPTSRLFDFALIKLSDEKSAVYVNLAHLIADHQGVTMAIRLLSEYYLKSLNGSLEEAPALPSFRDHVRREQEYLNSARAAAAAAYWSDKLGDSTEPLAFYGSIRQKRTTRVESISCELGPERTLGLQEAASDERIFTFSKEVSQFSVLGAIIAAYLHRISGSRRISLGVPFHNRRSGDETIGLFMRILPLRLSVDRDDSFLSVISKFSAEFCKALRHSEYPVSNALNKQAYDVVFNFMSDPFPHEFAGAPAMVKPIHPEHGHESLLIQIRQASPANWVLEMDFHCDVFDETCRRQAMGHFLAMVDNFLRDHSQPLRNVEFLTPAERAQILEGFNATEKPLPRLASYAQLFEAQVCRSPDRVAAGSQNQYVTYEILNQRANLVAHALAANGAGPDVVVALLAPRGLDFLTAMLGIFKAGAAYLPLEEAVPAQRLVQILAQSRSPVVVTAGGSDALFDALTRTAAGLLPAVLEVASLPFDGSAHSRPSADSQPDDLSYVIYTSGSTGIPKGAMVEQRGMINHLFAKVDELHLDAESVVAQTAAQSFDISVWQFLAALLVGGRVQIVGDDGRHDPAALKRLVEAEGVTVLETVPTMLRAILDEEASALPHLPLSSLRWLLVTGEALPPDLCRDWLKRRPHATLLNAYGPTECSDDVTHHLVARPPEMEAAIIPIGRPVANTQIYIVDENYTLSPVGMAGELCVGGAGVGRGYLGDSSRTAEAFIPDSFGRGCGGRLYRTGDLARYLADGAIEFLGRIDHQVKVRGYRIEPGEIEAHLRDHPAIREALVLTSEVAEGDKRLVGYLVPTEPQAITVGELRSYLEKRLPDYMIPSAFVLLDAFPLSANGKVNRQALPAPGSEPPDPNAVFVAPENAVQDILVRIWRKTLRLERVSVTDDFFELGGDSILAIQVAVRANQAGLRLSPMEIFAHHTIAELSEWLIQNSIVNSEQGLVTGPAPMTPSQQQWFEKSQPDAFGKATTVGADLKPDVDTALLEQALQQLILHHDALRLRFPKSGANRVQFQAGAGDSRLLVRIDISHLPEAEHQAALENIMSALQTGLELSEGPLIQAAFVRVGAGLPNRLLITAHPLVADDESWRILLADLQTAYEQLSLGETVRLPLKTTSFKQWAERLTDYARSGEFRSELDYWLAQSPAAAPVLPSCQLDGQAGRGPADSVRVSLDLEDLDDLGEAGAESAAISWADLSLTALALIVGRWAGSAQVLLDVKVDPRAAGLPDINLSRTVGPLTTTHPILLTVAEATVSVVESVKRQIDRVPNHGLGYSILRYLDEDPALARSIRELPQADVAFSYVEQADDLTRGSSLFEITSEPRETLLFDQTRGGYLLEIAAWRGTGQICFDWSFSRGHLVRATVERLADGFVKALRALAMQSLSIPLPADSPIADTR